MKLKLIAAAGAAAALALAGTASASPRLHHHAAVHVSVQHRVTGSVLNVAATYIGIDKATLVAGLKLGQSLAQIATAHGKTTDGLVTALLAPAKLKLDAAVAAGKITSDRETTLLSKLQGAVTALVNKTTAPHTRTHPIRLGVAAILQPALAYLGLDLKGVVAQLRTGKSLADVAVAQGKTGSGLVDAIVASVKTKLDAQVAAGRITSDQETTFLAQLQTSVTAFVNG